VKFTTINSAEHLAEVLQPLLDYAREHDFDVVAAAAEAKAAGGKMKPVKVGGEESDSAEGTMIASRTAEPLESIRPYSVAIQYGMERLYVTYYEATIKDEEGGEHLVGNVSICSTTSVLGVRIPVGPLARAVALLLLGDENGAFIHGQPHYMLAFLVQIPETFLPARRLDIADVDAEILEELWG
jgi:hypothetical protein